MANFIKEKIIAKFGVPHRIINNNGTPFVNSKVRKMLKFYQVKHHQLSPYNPKEMGRQRQQTNPSLVRRSLDLLKFS